MSGRIKTWIGVAGLLFSIFGLLSLFWLGQFPYRLSHLQEISFKKTYFLTPVFLIGGLACGITALCLTRRDSTRLFKGGAWASVLLSLIGLILLRFDVGSWGVHSAPSALNICINNQRSIDTAKEKWALRNSATSGTEVNWDQITADFPNGFPKCPEGGRYELRRVGEPVLCSNPNHRIPSQ